MEPLLVLQFMPDDGPGYLGTWAERHGVPCVVLSAAAGQPFPSTIAGHRALAILGGAMSANDDLPHLRDAERLIERCIRDGVPVLGHCLGGQLMARTLGARTNASPAPEVGWHRMQVAECEGARAWFGEADVQTVFHWHYEAFDLPPGATALGSSTACPVQAFSLGPHLGLQFHLEIDAQKIDAWLAGSDSLYVQAQLRHPTVQGPASVRQRTLEHLGSHQALADRVYSRWLGMRASAFSP